MALAVRDKWSFFSWRWRADQRTGRRASNDLSKQPCASDRPYFITANVWLMTTACPLRVMAHEINCRPSVVRRLQYRYRARYRPLFPATGRSRYTVSSARPRPLMWNILIMFVTIHSLVRLTVQMYFCTFRNYIRPSCELGKYYRKLWGRKQQKHEWC